MVGAVRQALTAQVPPLRAFARTLTGGDASFADDLVQDTMVNALQAQAQFTNGTNLKAWLFTILRNRFRSVVSRRHVTAEVSTENFDHLASVPPEQEAKLEVAAFRAAFRRLPPAQREALVLIAVDGLTYERAAEICNCEIGTIKSRMHRGRAQLKAMLLDGEDQPRPDAKRLPATIERRRLANEVAFAYPLRLAQ